MLSLILRVLPIILILCLLSLYGHSQFLPPIKRRNIDNSGSCEHQQKGAEDVCDDKMTNNSFIYCSGKLLQSVMYHRIYKDSKTFVDKPLVLDPNSTLDKFNQQFPEPIEYINKEKLTKFIEDHFHVEGHELEACATLDDWSPEPKEFKKIKDNTLREWALDLNYIWKELCRKVKKDVEYNHQKYSLIYVPNNVIIPGGRFREFYYWDTYWIVKGLLRSGMTKTVKGMIRNFFSMVEQYSFIPNGGRIYYLKRSQPPLLTSMVNAYFEATGDEDFLLEALPILERELSFWERRRTVTILKDGRNYTVFQYRADSNVPRPESYFEDVTTANKITQCDEKRKLWKNIASAAESGWDFSTRFFSNYSDFSSFDTTDVVEVDLNTILCDAYNTIATLYEKVNDLEEAKRFKDKYIIFENTFKKIFYSQQENGWFDYNIKRGTFKYEFFGSNFAPLYWKCYKKEDEEKFREMYKRVKSKGAFDYRGGLPMSLYNSEQQWDLPNGWAPVNHYVIMGLDKTDDFYLKQEAFKLAQKWILSNLRTYRKDKAMYEKYNVESEKAGRGGGGEYDVQMGFGWTNGVILDLLTVYGDDINMEKLDALCDELYPSDKCNFVTHTNNSIKNTTFTLFGLFLAIIRIIFLII